MAKEIERKFLVTGDEYRDMAVSRRVIVQGYLSVSPESTVRVRVTDDKAFITVKGKNRGISRNEWEYPIPVDDAREMLGLCRTALIEKVRWIVPYKGFTWEVDVFGGRLDGLVVAEIELPAADTQFEIPPFVGREVTHDPRYYNSYLSQSVI